MFTFNKNYFFLTASLFITEVLIALFINDGFIRPYLGDFLVVILIYCLLKTFWNAPVLTVALCTLIFSYIVEVLQYFKIVKLLGLQHSRAANLIIGNSFAWSDMLAYTLGILLVVLLEKKNSKYNQKNAALSSKP